MVTMTDKQILKDWDGLKKKHRMEIAEAITRFCIGRKMDEIAKLLGYTLQWMQSQLNYAGIGAAVGEGIKLITPPGQSGDKGVDHAVRKLVSQFAPSVDVKMVGQAGNQKIDHVVGKDSDEFESYLKHYIQEGHKPAAAIRLAKAEWAAGEAEAAGVIKPAKDKKGKDVNQIIFPKDKNVTFELDLKMHMARVIAASRFLDKAQVKNLRLRSTCKRVTEADQAWKVQAELVLQHYEPSTQEP